MSTSMLSSQMGDTTFNPRLRLDLASGQGSLRSLKESIGKVQLPAIARDPAESAAFPPVPPMVDYEKTIALLRGRHTCDMHDRHVTALRRIAASNARGFFLHDLASVGEIVRLASERAGTPALAAEYEGPTCDLLGALAVPFQKNRSNDDIRFEADVSALVRHASELACSASAAVAAGALEMVLALAVPPPPPTSTAEALAREAMTLGPRIESLKVLRMVIKAGAVPAIVGALARATSAENGQMGSSSRGGSHLGAPPAWERPALAAMRLLRALSRQPEGAAAICAAPGLSALVARLSLPLGQPMLSMAVESCWNLLESAPAAAAEALCTKDAIGRLVELHERTLSPGACDADRELRNEVLILATLLAKACDTDGKNALVRNGLYHAALSVVCADSARLVAANDLNLELLLLAMQFLLVTSADSEHVPEAAPYADAQFGLVDALLACLQPIEDEPLALGGGTTMAAPHGATGTGATGGGVAPIAAPMWAPAQRLELQKRSIKLLTNLAVAHPRLVADAQPAQIAEVLAHALSADAPAAMRDASIQLLVAAAPSSTALQAAAGDCGVVAELVELVAAISYCGSPTSLAPFSTQVVATTSALRVPTGLDASGMQAAVLALALLTLGSAENQARFGEAGGVACLLPLAKPRTDAALLHAVIECIWSAVVPSVENASKLVQRDGVLLLLDVLEGAPFAPRAHVLSCLADLIGSNGAALEQCLEWHGSRRQSATQLILALWQEESARRGEAAGSGVLQSSQRPLSTHSKRLFADLNASLVIGSDEPVEIGDAVGGGAATLGSFSSPSGGTMGDALKLTTKAALAIDGRLDGAGANHAALERVDVRAKLFALLSALGFGSSVALTPQEELLLTAAKEYVPLAAAEAWRDAADDFAADGLELLPEDGAKLTARLAADEQVAAALMGTQEFVAAGIAAGDATADAAELARVRVLRDGPMGQVQKAPRGTSLFRARIEAKARIAGMVSASKVGYRGPVPTAEEHADATVAAATEAMIEAGADPAVHGFTLRHVPQALGTLASAAGIHANYITPFLAEAGVGLTATGDKVDTAASLSARVQPNGHALLDVKALDKERSRRVTPAELRQLCIDFQHSVPN